MPKSNASRREQNGYEHAAKLGQDHYIDVRVAPTWIPEGNRLQRTHSNAWLWQAQSLSLSLARSSCLSACLSPLLSLSLSLSHTHTHTHARTCARTRHSYWARSRQVTRSNARLDRVLAAWGHSYWVRSVTAGHEIESEVGPCTGGSFLLS